LNHEGHEAHEVFFTAAPQGGLSGFAIHLQFYRMSCRTKLRHLVRPFDYAQGDNSGLERHAQLDWASISHGQWIPSCEGMTVLVTQ
jgi:hypothetical protein